MPPLAPAQGGIETAPYIPDSLVEPVEVVGPQVEEVGHQIVAENNAMPIESVPVVVDNIQAAIDRLLAERNRPGANRAAIDRKIGLLVTAKGHMSEAMAGLLAAREGYARYLGDTAMIDAGAGFRF